MCKWAQTRLPVRDLGITGAGPPLPSIDLAEKLLFKHPKALMLVIASCRRGSRGSHGTGPPLLESG